MAITPAILTFLLETTRTSGDVTSAIEALRLNLDDSMAVGTGLDQLDTWWADRRTATAAADAIDLTSLTTAEVGGTISMQKLKVLVIHNRSTTVGENLTLGNDANHVPLFGATTHTRAIGPNAIEFIWEPSLAGITVTATTGDIINLDPGAATITYDIVIGGIAT